MNINTHQTRWLLLVLLTLTVSCQVGCHKATIPPERETIFAPPATVPTVTPPLNTAYARNVAAEGDAVQLRDAVSTTPHEPAAAKVVAGVRSVGLAIAESIVTAAANDAAVATLNQQLEEARALVKQRDDDIVAIKSAHSDSVKQLEARISALQEQVNGAARRAANLMGYTASGGGALLVVVGIFLLVQVRPVTLGVLTMGVGLAAVALGFASLFLAREIAWVGLGIIPIGIAAAVWLTVRHLKEDAKSLIAGVEIAKKQEILNFAAAIDVFNTVQTPGAKKMVDETVPKKRRGT